MYDSTSYPKPTPDEIRRFSEAQTYATVMAQGSSGFPSASLLPFRLTETGDIEIHMVQADPTYQALRACGSGSILVQEFLAFTPHDLVDPVYAGMATLHFRAVLYDVTAEVSEDPKAVADVLSRLLTRYEPGASYHPVTDVPFYEADLRRLAAVTCHVKDIHAKFKTAQNRSPEERERITRYLRERGLAQDARAADAIVESAPQTGG